MREYIFDANTALGDTIMEKYESLYVKIANHNKEHKIEFVVGHPHTICLFESATAGFCQPPVEVNVGSLKLAGQIYPQGVMSFQCFKSEDAAQDELLLFGKTSNAVIKFINWLV